MGGVIQVIRTTPATWPTGDLNGYWRQVSKYGVRNRTR